MHHMNPPDHSELAQFIKTCARNAAENIAGIARSGCRNHRTDATARALKTTPAQIAVKVMPDRDGDKQGMEQ